MELGDSADLKHRNEGPGCSEIKTNGETVLLYCVVAHTKDGTYKL